MDIGVLIAGILIGTILTYSLLSRQRTIDRDTLRANIAEQYTTKAAADQAHIIQRYEARIRELETRHAHIVRLNRRDSTHQSRAVLKGKMAEQMAPLLPGFDYWPADARFLGDPIDYIVFNGYSKIKDRDNEDVELEVVILDIKKGARTTLSPGQREIAKAIEHGRVRFEVVRVFDDGTIRSHGWHSQDT